MGRIHVRIDKKKQQEFYRLAEKNSQVPSILIRKWIEDYIKNNKKEGEKDMVEEVKILFQDAKDVEENVGWEVYEIGAYLKDGEVKNYVGYTGQGIDANVHNKDYDDIVHITDYYKDYVNGNHELDDAVRLAVDLVNEMR